MVQNLSTQLCCQENHRGQFWAHYCFEFTSIDDLARLPLLDGGQVVLYADDLLLFHPIKSQEDYHHLQADIQMIEDRVNSNYLTLNLTKCKYMVVSQKRCPSAPVSLMLSGTEMEKVDCSTYLGLLLSSDMSFSKHVKSICSKARNNWPFLQEVQQGKQCYPIAAVPDNGETTSRICEPSLESLHT